MAIWIYLALSTFLGFCGFADACKQPRQAWQNAGKSKGLWVLITFVGMVSLGAGWITWLVYSYGGTRRAIKRGGGYSRPSQEAPIREATRIVIDELNMHERRDDPKLFGDIRTGRAPRPYVVEP